MGKIGSIRSVVCLEGWVGGCEGRIGSIRSTVGFTNQSLYESLMRTVLKGESYHKWPTPKAS